MGAYTEGKEILKDIIRLANGISDMELKNKIFELQSQFYELNDENRDLRNEVHALKNVSIMESELKYRNGVYQRGEDVFCAVCWDRDKKISRVRKVDEAANGTTAFACDVCNKWRFSDIPYTK